MRRIAIPVVLIVGSAAFAQDSQKTTKLAVGFAPGGTSSTSCRALALAAGSSFVVENLPGAGGKIAAEHILRRAGSDELLCMSSTSTLKVVPNSGLVPVGIFAEYDYVAVVRAGAPTTLAAYMAAAREPAGDSLRDVATAGGGSVPHLIGEMIFGEWGARMIHVAHSGSAQAILAVKTGAVAMAIVPYPDLVPFKDELRVVAITGDGIAVRGWMGIFAPPGTSPSEVVRLAGVFERAIPGAQKTFDTFGFKTGWREGPLLARRHQEDHDLLMPIAKRLKVTP